ncbi:MAG: hypothetical protein AAF600_04785 [Bacteroidota bacterium]
MESKQRKLPNKIDEQYILLILFLLVNMTAVIWFYVVHEYNQSNEVFETQYRFDESSIESYTSELKFQIILLSIILLITPLYLKYRKRWLLIAITLMHIGGVYCFFYFS